jgi:hypothetical protein
MAKKIILIILLLSGLNSISQEDTVRIDLSTANRIINDLEELDSLRVENSLNNLIISKYKVLTFSLENSLQYKDQQLELMRDNYRVVTKAYKDTFWDQLLNTLKDVGLGVGIFAVGFLAGSL